jgi:hypothetical protein
VRADLVVEREVCAAAGWAHAVRCRTSPQEYSKAVHAASRCLAKSCRLLLHGRHHQQSLTAAFAAAQPPTLASRACLGFRPPYLADRASVCWVCVSGLFDS